VTDRVRDLEAALGDPLQPRGALTYGQAVADDLAERFPHSSLDKLHAWGYSAYQVPEVLGGRLASLEELAGLGRVVAGRDPTVAVIANASVAAAMPVWLTGNPRQQTAVARAVLAGQRVALGLTEREHGADLLSTEVTGRRTEAGYVLNGTKWLINNVRLARYMCLLVREPDRDGLRSLSLLLVDLQGLPAEAYELLAKVHTHGIRGADIAGIRFTDALVPPSAIIGQAGRGLEITAQSLVVTRALVPALSLGALDTALGCTVHFLRERRLYGGFATDIPFVQNELAAALLDRWVAEVVAGCCIRILQRLPGLAPVSSAVAKYLVPHIVELRLRALGVAMGARSFLQEDHWFGIFEKLLRDSRLFSVFDGSEPVVLSALAAQASCLVERNTDPRDADVVFNGAHVGQTYAHPFGSRWLETVADEDPVTAGLDDVCTTLEASADEPHLCHAVSLLRAGGRDLRGRAERAVDPRSEAGQRLGECYARHFAAVCLARSWLGSRGSGGREIPSQWLAAGLLALLRPGVRMPQSTSRSLFAELLRSHAGGNDSSASSEG
jgi:alkylation response protein AidB-like acyl-CoA dehydrogenase